jgi:hypothetical protein
MRGTAASYLINYGIALTLSIGHTQIWQDRDPSVIVLCPAAPAADPERSGQDLVLCTFAGVLDAACMGSSAVQRAGQAAFSRTSRPK